jgi:hypothetical protein
MPNIKRIKGDDEEEGERQLHLRKVKWAIAFCQVSLKEFRPREWRQIKKDIYKFSYGGVRFFPGTKKNLIFDDSTEGVEYLVRHIEENFIKTLSNRKVYDVQGAIFDFLKPLAYGPSYGAISMGAKKVGFNFSWNRHSPFTWDVRIDDTVTGARIAFGAHLVGSRISVEHLRRCAESDCGVIFLANRKPRSDREHHCSIDCARKAARRRYREKNGRSIQMKDRERKKRSYDARIHQKFPRARIGRHRG